MAYFVVLGNMVVNSVAQAVAPTLARSRNDSDRSAFKRLLGRLVLGAVVLGLIGVLGALTLGPEVLVLVYGSEFVVDASIFGMIMFAGLLSFVCTFLSYALITMRHLSIQPVIFAATCIVSALACFLLVPLFGLGGAAAAWTASMLVQLMLTGSYLLVTLKRSTAQTS
jgi:O-antigen/teichoic acid export membrane protein